MNDVLAFYLTVSTYGTWLPGDQRGWVEYRHGWQMPNPIRELEAHAKMTEDACVLTPRERQIVEVQIVETCKRRGWLLHAKNCRSNHVHVLLSAHDTSPRKVRIDVKSWCTRRLKEGSDPQRVNWWAERGSIRHVFDEKSLETIVQYVNQAQDRKHLSTQS